MCNVKVPESFSDLCLWIDSSNFQKKKYKGVSPKSLECVYDFNSPGIKYMFINDGKHKIRKVWERYHLKVDDAGFLKIERDWIEENLVGAGIIGDTGFQWERKHFKKVKFY